MSSQINLAPRLKVNILYKRNQKKKRKASKYFKHNKILYFDTRAQLENKKPLLYWIFYFKNYNYINQGVWPCNEMTFVVSWCYTNRHLLKDWLNSRFNTLVCLGLVDKRPLYNLRIYHTTQHREEIRGSRLWGGRGQHSHMDNADVILMFTLWRMIYLS